jgi:hypothetical protein
LWSIEETGGGGGGGGGDSDGDGDGVHSGSVGPPGSSPPMPLTLQSEPYNAPPRLTEAAVSASSYYSDGYDDDDDEAERGPLEVACDFLTLAFFICASAQAPQCHACNVVRNIAAVLELAFPHFPATQDDAAAPDLPRSCTCTLARRW